jgi:hypothetical protein
MENPKDLLVKDLPGLLKLLKIESMEQLIDSLIYDNSLIHSFITHFKDRQKIHDLKIEYEKASNNSMRDSFNSGEISRLNELCSTFTSGYFSK